MCSKDSRSRFVLHHRFKAKPKKGVKFLQDKGLLGKAPDDVATLFHKDERLDKVLVCEFHVSGCY